MFVLRVWLWFSSSFKYIIQLLTGYKLLLFFLKIGVLSAFSFKNCYCRFIAVPFRSFHMFGTFLIIKPNYFVLVAMLSLGCSASLVITIVKLSYGIYKSGLYSPLALSCSSHTFLHCVWSWTCPTTSRCYLNCIMISSTITILNFHEYDNFLILHISNSSWKLEILCNICPCYMNPLYQVSLCLTCNICICYYLKRLSLLLSDHFWWLHGIAELPVLLVCLYPDS